MPGPSDLTEAVVAALTAPASIKRLLDALGLPSRAPPIAPSRHPQLQEIALAISLDAA